MTELLQEGRDTGCRYVLEKGHFGEVILQWIIEI
jgi:hypothetical protein